MPERRCFNYACPLCLEVVDVKQPTCFRVLPLDLECTELINETPEWRGFSIYHWGELAVGNIGFKPSEYPVIKYAETNWLLHTRCLDLVRGLSIPKLHLLIRLVEPTFVSEASKPASKHGAFYSTQPFPISRPTAPQQQTMWQQMMEYVWSAP